MTEQPGEFLKCDTFQCDFFEMTPVVAEAVGRPCPKCGAVLLTQHDFVTFRAVQAEMRAQHELTITRDPDAPLVLVATNVSGGVIRRRVVENADSNPFPNEARP